MRQLSSWMLFAMTVSLGAPSVLVAQLPHFHRPGCCATCTLPTATCQCAQTRAVVQTELRAQAVTTMKCVTETHVRKETYAEQTPVTKVETVTVDEGGYQMVWVPKPVTKQIARTTMTTQIKSREVPYQITRAVPQTEIRMVPHQTVRHVTEVMPVTTVSRPVVMGCNTCQTGTALSLPPVVGYHAPIMPSSTALAPIPVQQTAQGSTTQTHSDWQAIPVRQSVKAEAKPTQVPMPTDDEPPVVSPKTSGRFKSVPSAAVVWGATGHGARPSPSVPAQNLAQSARP